MMLHHRCFDLQGFVLGIPNLSGKLRQRRFGFNPICPQICFGVK